MGAANRYTTTELLTSIKAKGHLPTSQSPFDDPTLLSFADDELATALLAQIKNTRENFYLTYTDQTPNATGQYTIPARAIGGGLALLQLTNGTMLYPISRNELSEQFSTVTSPSGFYGFYIQGNQINVLPVPTSGTIRMWYYMAPNKLALPTACAQIGEIDFNSGILTCNTSFPVPSTFNTLDPVDLIKDQPGFDRLQIDVVPNYVSVGSQQVGLPTLPTNLLPGDWVALSGQTPVPNIPVEFRPLLVQRVIVKYYEVQGYTEKMKNAEAKLQQMERAVFQLINPRIAEAPKRIVADGSLIGGYQRWRRWRAT